MSDTMMEAMPEAPEALRLSDAFSQALQRAQGEFIEMPGLQLTEAQAARLWSFDSALCSAVLSELVASHFLIRTRRNLFARA